MKKILLTCLWALSAHIGLFAQTGFSDLRAQEERLQALAKNNPRYAQLRSLARTDGDRNIWLLTLGGEGADTRPAIVVAGGLEGNHPLSTELAIGFAENLLKGVGTDSVQQLLNKTTYYIFPNLNPDAAAQYFATLQYERTGNARDTDDDRDGRMNEDGPEDLDGDGKITWLRITSPTGEYIPHPDDPRVLIKADPAKGERGIYQILPEGIDNDKDGKWNEDGPGGVDFNKNFSFKHPSFSAGAGEFPVSEKETRALLDFLYEHYNVYALLQFSSHNNLSQAMSYVPAQANARITSGWQEADVKVNQAVSELYNQIIKQKDAPKSPVAGGDMLSWGYFHYGRFSFSTPGWWVPKTKPDSSRGEKAFTREDATAQYLRWAGQKGIANIFTPWKKITHPDFPGQEVELGGLHPFAQQTPAPSLLPELVEKHSRFLQKLAAMQPELDLVNLKTEKLGNGLTRVTVDVLNKGLLPTTTKLGERSNWVKRIQVKANMASGQQLISGKARQTLGALGGQSSETLSWLIKGSGRFSIEAGSPATGRKTIQITL
jgi:hypothetical protein